MKNDFAGMLTLVLGTAVAVAEDKPAAKAAINPSRAC